MGRVKRIREVSFQNEKSWSMKIDFVSQLRRERKQPHIETYILKAQGRTGIARRFGLPSSGRNIAQIITLGYN